MKNNITWAEKMNFLKELNSTFDQITWNIHFLKSVIGNILLFTHYLKYIRTYSVLRLTLHGKIIVFFLKKQFEQISSFSTLYDKNSIESDRKRWMPYRQTSSQCVKGTL